MRFVKVHLSWIIRRGCRAARCCLSLRAGHRRLCRQPVALILKIHAYPLFGACYASAEMCARKGKEMGAGLEHLRFQPALAPVFRDIRGRPVEAIKRNGGNVPSAVHRFLSVLRRTVFERCRVRTLDAKRNRMCLASSVARCHGYSEGTR